MAGGIDWFRWHHGSVTDPKFGLIAKKAGARLGDVLAVWAFVLESASANEDRGTVGAIDAESLEFLLDLEPGAAYRILDAMTQRGLLGAGGVVVAWEKRQPKRERPDDNSAARTRSYRDRQASSSDATQSHVTPCDATERQETPREEKSREEEKEPKTKTARKRAAPAVLVSVSDLVADGVEEQAATDWLVVRRAKSLPLTPTAWQEVKAEAIKAGISPGEAVKAATVNGWGGFKAAWLQQPSRNGPVLTAHDRKAAEAAKWMTPSKAAFDFIDMEATDAAPLALR